MTELIHRTKTAIDECFPPKILSNRALKRAEEPWFDKEICKEENQQAKLFRKFRSTNNSADHKNYNNFRKRLRKKKKRRKKAYFRDLIKVANAKKDFRKTWQAINKVLNKNRNKLVCPTSVIVGSKQTQCSRIIANMLNKHFTFLFE